METKAGPKDIFLHLLAILLLYAAAGSFVTLWFQYINIWVPDPLTERGYYYLQSAYSSIRWSVAILIVVFPVYVWANWLLRKMYAQVPERRELKTRKWLLYLTLFAAGLVILGDLVALVFNFLQGELTARFLLKILAVGVVAGAIFGYYFFELKGERQDLRRYLAWLARAVVLFSVVLAFFFAGSPKEERARRFDDRRVQDLQTIQGQLINFWQAKERLPKNLAELKDDIRGFAPPKDPENTSADYGYEITGKLNFKLCANFARENASAAAAPEPTAAYPAKPYFGGESWQHQAGRQCFERAIDPELYKPFLKGR